MLEKKAVLDTVYDGIKSDLSSCGYSPVFPEGVKNFESPAYIRGNAAVIDFSGEKGLLRIVLGEDKIHFLLGEKGIQTADDSDYTVDCTFLCLLDEYDDRDVKSIINEMRDHIEEAYTKKNVLASRSGRAPTTVSKAAAKSGLLSYDPITLASRLAVMYPELKPELKKNTDTYGDFLAEDFFINYANACILRDFKENNALRMRKLFGILSEIYEDGSNEVQSLIAVTVIGETTANNPGLLQNIIPYLSDTMLEPVVEVSKHIAKSKSARLRLENPPAYKPKKQKKKSEGILSQLGL